MKKYKIWFGNSDDLEKAIEEANSIDVETLKKKPEFSPAFDLPWLYEDLFEGEYAISTKDGRLVTRKNGKLVIDGKDEEWLGIYKKYQDALRYKENTAFKIIERTAKRDVWSRAALYLDQVTRQLKNKGLSETDIDSLISYTNFFKEKAKSHTDYLNEQRTYYDYATQTFVPKTSDAECQK